MKIYCSCCDKVQPVRIDNCRDAKTNEPFQDIVCAECDLVIASGTDIERPQMQPCAGRNCGSTNPNLHSAECFEDYEKATGMRAWQGLTDEEVSKLIDNEIGFNSCCGWEEEYTRAVEAKLKEKNQ